MTVVVSVGLGHLVTGMWVRLLFLGFVCHWSI